MNISELLSLLEYKIIWPCKFGFYKLIYKVDDKTVLFADPYSNDLTDNMVPIYTALQNRGGFNLVKCFNAPITTAPNLVGKIRGRINRGKVYDKFLKAYAKAGTVFLTESMLSAYAVKPRQGTRVVQLWHGSGAFKKWGYSTLDKSFGASRKSATRFPMHNCYSLVPVSASEVIPHWAEAFGCDASIIKPLGVPRTDEFFNGDLKSHDFGDKKVILYAPTFRGNNVILAHNDNCLDIEALHSALGDDYVLLLKMHPFVKSSIAIPESCKGFCLDISDIPTNKALKMADILITDYSSIIFEYSLLGRPMVFYPYDLESFIGERDFYYPYESFVPGPIAKTQDSLVSTLLSLDANAGASRSAAFADTYMSACDGHSTERILSALGLIGGNNP